MRIREQEIGTTAVGSFDSFMVAQRNEHDSGVPVDHVRPPRLPKFYHPLTPAQPGPNHVLVIEVEDSPITEQTVERVRGALLERLSATGRS